MTKIENYYLNLKKLEVLEREDYIRIYEMYRDMLYNFQDSRTLIAESFFNTLYKGGYLLNMREEKIEEILNGIDSVNT